MRKVTQRQVMKVGAQRALSSIFIALWNHQIEKCIGKIVQMMVKYHIYQNSADLLSPLVAYFRKSRNNKEFKTRRVIQVR